MNPRKISKFVICERHASWFAGETRYRTAECFAEGGPGSVKGCAGGVCRLWPGRDFYIEELCHSEMELEWATPQ